MALDNVSAVSFRYQLRDATGDDLGDAEYAYQPVVGDTIRTKDNVRMRVVAVVPLERIEEHVDRPLYGLLEITPV